MKGKHQYSPQSRLRSMSHAVNGIATFFVSEPNAKIHLLATILVVAAGVIRDISVHSWLAITIAIGMVWITEAINTAMEKLCDYACDKEYHNTIKQVKDIAAGAVLIASVCSIIIAILVFI